MSKVTRELAETLTTEAEEILAQSDDDVLMVVRYALLDDESERATALVRGTPGDLDSVEIDAPDAAMEKKVMSEIILRSRFEGTYMEPVSVSDASGGRLWAYRTAMVA